jgi:hypothetical protein
MFRQIALPLPVSFVLSFVLSVALSFVLSTTACVFRPAGEGEGEGEGEDEGDGDGDDGRYAFRSRFVSGASAVAYSGQAARQLLLRELLADIDGLDDTTIAGRTVEQLRARFAFFFDFKPANGGTTDEPVTITAFGTPLLQTTVGEVGVASLRDKLRDLDLGDPAPVRGWNDGRDPPSVVIDAMFDALARTFVARAAGPPRASDGTTIAVPTIDATGHDWARILETFIAGAVFVSQASDDYLDDDTPDKGILSDNTVAVDDKPYTALEHAWDEAFGYFGAARSYGTREAGDNVAGFHDDDGDGRADWLTEVSFGVARDAALRDVDSVGPTRFGRASFDAFLAGRRLITAAGGPLAESDRATLRDLRSTAEQNWERAAAATLIHHCNALLRIVDDAASTPHDFVGHATHWSLLYGGLLALQFNPRGRVFVDDAAVYTGLLERIPTVGAPTVSALGTAAVRDTLETIRDALGALFSFDPNDTEGW